MPDADKKDEQLVQPEDNAAPPSNEDNPRDGLGVSGNIASILYDAATDVEGHGGAKKDDDPREGLGTSGTVKGPRK